MNVSRLKYRVEVLDDRDGIRRYGPFNAQKAREFFEVEESLGGTARIVRLEEERFRETWLTVTECGDWDGGPRAEAPPQ
ncbi:MULTISPECIES: hypothetical protein [Methanoculleus]|uniref:Uncharacterized protein n=2 Tax=Methanoculleus TaxID=45989 RepID=A3CY95_METMJ|nr:MULTISPECIES: hypothetical protein [Methanoculleus]ABN58345.1 hypothetical protein Memar_2424 [Methanoculleus marisnigri JR1]MCC7554585.1 hypothetical protein [Methanoculleus marisnigri]UYU17345.1 hypothetical protein OH143_06380 [Methanoculleus submarinus]